MDPEQCAICNAAAADAAHPIVVSMKKALGQDGSTLHMNYLDVPVPACSPCASSEASREQTANGIGLAIMVVPIFGFAAMGLGWMFGLGVGFFGGIIARAFLNGGGKACQLPRIQELTQQGWDFNHLFVK